MPAIGGRVSKSFANSALSFAEMSAIVSFVPLLFAIFALDTGICSVANTLGETGSVLIAEIRLLGNRCEEYLFIAAFLAVVFIFDASRELNYCILMCFGSSSSTNSRSMNPSKKVSQLGGRDWVSIPAYTVSSI
jgi:hypothetical protein